MYGKEGTAVPSGKYCIRRIIMTERERKNRILEELLGERGKNLWITAPFYVDYGHHIFFGNNCEVNMNCTFLDDNIIRIGDNALIAPNVQIYTAFHPANAEDRFGNPGKDGSFAEPRQRR